MSYRKRLNRHGAVFLFRFLLIVAECWAAAFVMSRLFQHSAAWPDVAGGAALVGVLFVRAVVDARETVRLVNAEPFEEGGGVCR